MSEEIWRCAGCGIEAPDKFGHCDCPTTCIYLKSDRSKITTKFKGCINHPKREIRENLDGDNLCVECCIAWAKNEGENHDNPR